MVAFLALIVSRISWNVLSAVIMGAYGSVSNAATMVPHNWLSRITQDPETPFAALDVSCKIGELLTSHLRNGASSSIFPAWKEPLVSNPA